MKYSDGQEARLGNRVRLGADGEGVVVCSFYTNLTPIALAERWDVFCVPASSHPMPYRHLLLTDVFVDRVRSLGLKGLDFQHVGYIVSDPSQVVPKPPAPPPPPPKPSKHKVLALTSGPIPADEQIELAEVGAEWRRRLVQHPLNSFMYRDQGTAQGG